MNKICYVAARCPRPGQVKTRLGAVIGHEAAAALYAAFLLDLEAKLGRASFPVCWYVTPGAWADRPHREQGDGDWNARQARLFEEAAGRGEERVVLIASDSPQIDLAVIHEAFSALEHNDLVLGPVEDGGYYLIGMRGWHDVFHGVAMTSSTALHDVVSRAEGLRLSVAFVDPLFDVDVAGDLEHLTAIARVRDDLLHTRQALRLQGRVAA
ncbi:MAG: TIGR04282 family arsenosugar biosynthesis glycosyltransferase [Candidatus Dormibacteraeota bacterium]|nr:TIGR04282 family arsenosugar biosynthesis glycosyltransferase [Candidatus Dormibacteraeota bacterium]